MIISLENPAFHRSAMTNFTKIFFNFFALTNFLHLEIEWAVFSIVVGGCFLNSRRWLLSQQSQVAVISTVEVAVISTVVGGCYLKSQVAVISTVVGGCYLNSRRWLLSQQSQVAVISTVVGGCYLNSRRWLLSQQSQLTVISRVVGSCYLIGFSLCQVKPKVIKMIFVASLHAVLRSKSKD